MIPRGLGMYVYLRSLERDAPKYAASMRTATTFDLNNTRKDHQDFNVLENAISVLRRIAASESAKEHHAIQSYINKLDKHLNDTTNPIPDAVRTMLERQKQHLQKFNDEGYTPDQFDIIDAINVIKQNLNTYERRLSELMQRSSTVDLSERFEYRIQPDMENFIRNQGKNASGSADDIKRDKMLKKELEKIKDSNSFLNHLPASLQNEILAILYVDFNHWLETNQKNYYKKVPIENFKKFLNDTIKEYVSKSKSATEQTHVQRLIETNNFELVSLMADLNKMWHGTYLSSSEAKEIQSLLEDAKKYNERIKNPRKKQNSIETSSNMKYSLNQAENLLKTYNEQIDPQDSSNFSFTLHTASSHGNFYEFLLTIISSAINVRANIGADVIAPIGTFTFNIDEQKQQQLLVNFASQAGDLLSTAFEEQDKATIKDLDNLIEKQKQVSTNVYNKLQQTAQSLQKYAELGDEFFVAHESLKLYGTAEKSKTEFHGRDMKALSVLTKLYATPEIADALIGREKLIIYLLNLSPSTLARESNKEPLETYFSLFASMLMFDNLEEMTKEYVEQIENNLASTTVNCLHVYNVNGIYFPVSVILNNLIGQCDECAQQLSLSNNNTAVANIHYPKRIFKPEHSELEDWSALADKQINKVSIQITFLKGFYDYITKLFTNLGN